MSEPRAPDTDLTTSSDGDQVQGVLRRMRAQRRATRVPTFLHRLLGEKSEKPKYVVSDEIGAGGVGIVYRGRDQHLDREVALKFLNERYRDDPGVVARFLEEAQIGGQLDHPGIVPIHEIGMRDDRLFFAMKMIRGRSLAELLTEGSTSSQRFLSIFEAICQTVAYAHDRGIIHRDLKPANVMVGAFGEVQVVDWGMAKIVGRADAPAAIRRAEDSARQPSLEGSVLGTPEYMPPEQARGEIDRLTPRSDVFALGAILLELLTGAPPYRQTGALRLAAARDARLDDARDRLDQSPADTDVIDLCRACLAADPAQRPRDAKQVAETVRRHQENVEQRAQDARVAAARAEVKAKAERRARRLTVGLASSITLLLVVIGAGWTILEINARSRQQATDTKILDHLRAASDASSSQDWAKAIASAKAALALAETGVASPMATDRARSESERIQRAATTADHVAQLARETETFLRELTNIRQPEADPNYPRAWGPIATDYGSCFRRYGHALLTEGDEPNLEALERRGRSEEFAAHLDSWSAACRRSNREKEADQLLRLSGRIDREASRQSLREAITAGDTKTLRKFADRPELVDLPPATLHLLAQALLTRGAAATSRSVLERSCRRYPRDYALIVGLARSYYSSLPRRPQLAARYFLAALTLRPDSFEVRHQLGRVLGQELGEHTSALEHFKACLATNPEDAHIWWHLAQTHRDLDDLEQAEAALKRCLTLGKEPLVWSSLATIYLNQGQPAKAEDAVRKYLKTNPKGMKAWSTLAEALSALQRRDEAIDAYRKAIENSTGYGAEDRSILHSNLGRLLILAKQKDLALKELLRATEIHPRNGRAWSEIGMIYFVRRKDEEARSALEKAVRWEPSQSLPWTHLGIILRDQGEYGAGVRAIQSGLENAGPRNDWRKLAQKHLHRTYQLWGHHLQRFDVRGAIPKYEAALRMEPKDPSTLFQLAVCLRGDKRTPEAIATYRKLLAVQPDMPEAWCNLGMALRATGKLNDALEALEKGHTLGSKRANWRYPSAKWVTDTREMLRKRR